MCSSLSRTARSAARPWRKTAASTAVLGIVFVLRQQARNHAGKQIAAAALGHAGIAGGIHGHAAVGMRDQRARAFQHDGDAVLPGKVARDLEPVGLDLRG